MKKAKKNHEEPRWRAIPATFELSMVVDQGNVTEMDEEFLSLFTNKLGNKTVSKAKLQRILAAYFAGTVTASEKWSASALVLKGIMEDMKKYAIFEMEMHFLRMCTNS